MSIKAKAEKALKLYFVLVTLITILLMILGLGFDHDRTFSYEAFASPLIYAAIGVIPVFLFDSEKELTVRQLIITRVIELAIVEAIVMVLAFSADTIPTEKRGVVIGIAAGIAVIFVLSQVLEYVFESATAKQLNESLEDYQKVH